MTRGMTARPPPLPDTGCRCYPRGITDDVTVLDEFLELGAVEDADARLRRSVREQQRLEMELIDAVAPLRAGGQWPSAPFSPRTRPARDGSLMRDSSAPSTDTHIATSLRYSRGSPVLRNPVGQAEPAKNLHRTHRDLVALDVRRLAGTAGLGHGHINVARGKFHR